MARSATKINDDDAQQAARSGWLSGLFGTLFARPARARRTDRKQAAEVDKSGAPAQGGGKSAAPGSSGDHAMHIELSALFKAAPGSHEALRHLAAVRHGLKHKDSKGLFLFGAEPSQLRTALRQLDGLMPRQPTPGLAALRARM